MMVIKVVDHVIAVAIVHRDENRWRNVVVALTLLSPALTAGRQRGAHRRPFDVMHHAQRHTPRSLRCGRRLRRRGWRVKSALRRRVMGQGPHMDIIAVMRCEIAHSQFGHSLGTGPGIFYARNSGSAKDLGTFSTNCINAFSNCVRLEDLIFV